jgi:hypothetical protein
MSAKNPRGTEATPKRPPAIWPRLLAGMLAVPLLAGCRAAMPHATTQTAVPSDTNAELVEYIGDMPYVTAEAAYRAVYILAKGQVFQGDFDTLEQQMIEAGLVGAGWHYKPDQFLDRAAIGYLVARACNIRTGVNWVLTGLGRYAYRELIFRSIARPSGEWNLISGGEFLGVLARAEEYLHNVGRAPYQAAELGEEPF